jgi:predicted ATPase
VNSNPERFFVVTGGPGSGKSTLIAALAGAGHAQSIEAGRAIIQDQVSIEGAALPWCDPALFAEVMLSWEMRSFRIACEQTGPVFFDRGVPDVAGYLRLLGMPVPRHIETAIERFRYNRRVFIAPPWPEIFQQDSERNQTLDEAIRTYKAMVATYTQYGYELLALPLSSVEDRVGFVTDNLGAS